LRAFAILLVVLFFSASHGLAAPMLFVPPDRQAIEAALQGEGDLTLSGRTLDRNLFLTLYQKRDFEAIWTEQRSASFARALDQAASHGIDAAAFIVPARSSLNRELLTTDAFLRYASALTRGRVRPADVETDWRIASPSFDPAKVLDLAIAGDAASVLADLAPHASPYEALRGALQHYRDLAKVSWRPIKNLAPLKPGETSERVLDLRERLIVEGFAQPVAENADPALYDDMLTEAVSRFQTARGLTVDGAAGRGTLAALNISPVARVKQLRMNLERWRSLPRIDATTRVEVNVAAATAVLYRANQPLKIMRAIVGAVIHPTPVLRARMISVLFNPPWNVPSSIIENEIRPALKKDPKYLQKHGYAYWDVNGGKQLVQVPGPKNSLGQIKFEMPNPDDIYMHDTPEKRLFTQARRAFSHGCVRVEDPNGFAELVLDGPEWSSDAINAAIAAKQTRSVALPRKIPVYMLYWTAFVDADGTVEFRDDIYGRDRRLADALAAQDAAEHMASDMVSAKKG
jgi:L,D-transpeptidase YcbB